MVHSAARGRIPRAARGPAARGLLAFAATMVSACIAPPTRTSEADTRVAIILGDGPSRARMAPLDGTSEVLADVEPGSTVLIGTLELPYGMLLPGDPTQPRTVDLVPADAPGARPLPLVGLTGVDLRPLEGLPVGLIATHLPALSDNRCAAIEGCADILATESVGDVRACVRPCPPAPAPEPPAQATVPAPPAEATSRAPEGCGVRVDVDTATAGFTLARCRPPAPRAKPACSETERATFDDTCASLTTCADFPAELDEARTWFVHTGPGVDGDGSRARPARSLTMDALPEGIDTIAARGVLPLDGLPSRPWTIIGRCPADLMVTGALSTATALTLARLRFDGSLAVLAGSARLAAVAWVPPRPVALDMAATTELALEDVALRAPTSTDADVPLWRLERARVSGLRISIDGPPLGAARVEVLGGELHLEDVGLDRVSLSAQAGAVVTLARARGRAAETQPLVDARGSSLSFRASVLSGPGPEGLLRAVEGRLGLVDVAGDVVGPFVLTLRAALDASDVALMIAGADAVAGVGAIGGSVTLERVDLLTLGPIGLHGRDVAVRATDVVIERAADGDSGVTLNAGTSTITRAVVSGIGRRGVALYGGRHALADVHVALVPPDDRRVEPPDIVSTGLSLFDDQEALDLKLERARIQGGFFGVHAQLPRGRAWLRDVDVGPSTIRREDLDIVEPCALRLRLISLDAARLRAQAHGEQGLLLDVPAAEPDAVSDTPNVRVEDLVVGAVRTRLPEGIARCSGLAVPAVAVTAERPVALRRVALRDSETHGVVVRMGREAELSLTDLDVEDVRCRLVDARGSGRVHVERMAARRRLRPRDLLVSDELLNATGSSQLWATDVDAQVEDTRAVVRINESGALELRRWRATFGRALLLFDPALSQRDSDGRPLTRTIEDGVLDRALRVTSLSPVSCSEAEARPPYLRVRFPQRLAPFETCP